MTHFYLTLPSNSSMNYYNENTPQNFKVKLPKVLDFTGKDYEVGLAEIQYPYTWYTLDENNNDIFISYSADQETTFNTTKMAIPVGIYTSIDQLITSINTTIKGNLGTLTFEMDPFSFKTKIRREPTPFTIDAITYTFFDISLSVHLCRILGFKESDTNHSFYAERETSSLKKNNYETFYLYEFNPSIIEQPEVVSYMESTYPCDINRGLYNLFVYSNIVTRQIIGDTYAPLLRTIPIEDKPNTVITKNFDLPFYLPVSGQIIDTIEIDIRDDTGTPVVFTYGKVLVKLHFRLRRSPYFE